MRVTGRGRARSSSVSGAALARVFGAGLGVVIARLPPHGIGADDAHDPLRRRAEPQLGGGEQAVDDVGGAAHPVVDERRLAVGADDEQRRRLALRQAGRELDVDLGAVIEHAARLPGRIALDAIAELQLVDVDAGVGHGRAAASASARCFLSASSSAAG